MAKDSDLIPGETELLRVTRHPVVLVGRAWKGVVVGLVVTIGLVLIPAKSGPVADLRWFGVLAALLLMLVYLEVLYVRWRSETYTITDQRVLLRRGVVGRFSRSISLDRVQDVSTFQGAFGRMLDYGTIEVESAGKDGAEVLTYVPHPTDFRNLLFEHIRGGAAS